MPRAFDEREREALRERLLDRGEELLARFGLRKTAVEDITRAAGISKGAFYAFFESKEELAWQVLRRIESREREGMRRRLAGAASRRGGARDALAAALHHALSAATRHPALKALGGEMDLLARRVPAAAVEEHLESDRRFLEEARPLWEREGLALAVDPTVATGMIRSLFFAAMHGEELAGSAFPAVQKALVDAVVASLFTGSGRGQRRARGSGR